MENSYNIVINIHDTLKILNKVLIKESIHIYTSLLRSATNYIEISRLV